MTSRLFDADFIGRVHDQLGHLRNIMSGWPGVRAEPLAAELLVHLLDQAFWASLRQNEGRTTRVALAVAPRENSPDITSFTSVEYSEVQIAKLAPAVPTSGCLLVSATDGQLEIWGVGRRRPDSWVDTVIVDLADPGIVRVDIGPFRPFAVLDGRSNPILAGTGIDLATHLQRVLRKAIPTDDVMGETQAVWRECLSLANLARRILVDGHGGTVLIVPAETGEWSRSLDPFAYRFDRPDTQIRDGIRHALAETADQSELARRLSETELPDEIKNSLIMGAFRPQREWYPEVGIRGVAALAAVDGAVVMTRDLRVLGFGAKIAGRSDAVSEVCMVSAGPGSQPVVPSPLEQVGGTRHQSAARFVGINRDSLALVISQDRHMSIFQWEQEFGYVFVIRHAEWMV